MGFQRAILCLYYFNIYKLSSAVSFLLVDRYRDIYQPEVVEGRRVEAAHHILEIIKKMDINWDRAIKPLPGWEGSL